MSAKHESGLSRWARRKTEARSTPAVGTAKRGAALPATAVDADTVPDAPQNSVTDATTADRAGDTAAREGDSVPGNLPNIETLDYDSDYAGFLSKDVSDAVRNTALRKLWRSNPLLANVDGLVDYDDDFSDAATVIEGMKSAYRIGRGMVQDEPDGTEEMLASTATDADASQAEEDPGDTVATDDTTPTQPETETQTSQLQCVIG